MPSELPEIAAARKQVAAASRRLAADGLVLGAAGNVSVRAAGADGDVFAITPTGAVLGTLEAEQVTVVEADGSIVGDSLAPTSEVDLHLGIYARHGAGAVVHTHSPMATALACVLDEVPCVHYQMLSLGGPVPVAPYRTFGTPELAEVTIDALKGRSAALMANHGAITHGPTIDSAVESTLFLEWACNVYWHAASIGEPRALDVSQRAAVVSATAERGHGQTREIGEG